jgi:hypothetical protein
LLLDHVSVHRENPELDAVGAGGERADPDREQFQIIWTDLNVAAIHLLPFPVPDREMRELGLHALVEPELHPGRRVEEDGPACG